MSLKRLWDTENKKIVWAVDKSEHKKAYQVWTNDDGSKLYIYKKDKWVELDQTEEDVKEYWPVWKALNDEMVGYYLTSEATDLYNWDSGDEAAYRFLNGTTVLQSWTVDEGETPEYTGDTPTKAATAQYTYTFSGWKPTVGPISKKTDFKAQFTSTVNDYTITWKDGDDATLDTDTVAYGGTPEYTWLTPTKTATAQYTYTWDEWWTPAIATVTGNATYTATFTSTVNQYTVSIASNDETYGTVDVASVTADYGTAISAESNVLTIGETEITATAETGYHFSSWGTLPETVTETLSITATFEADAPVE